MNKYVPLLVQNIFLYSILFVVFTSKGMAATTNNSNVWKINGCENSPSKFIKLNDSDGKFQDVVEQNSCVALGSAARKIQNKAGFIVSEIYISASKEVNAFATYDRNGAPIVVVNIGMLEALNADEDAWAGLLGHEVAHLVKHHGDTRKSAESGAKTLGQGIGNVISHLIPGLGGWALGTAAGAATTWATYGAYTRPQEAEADALGVEWMTRAGYDPDGMLRLMSVLKKKGSEGLSFLSTHPTTSERDQAIRTLISSHYQEWRPTESNSLPAKDASVASTEAIKPSSVNLGSISVQEEKYLDWKIRSDGIVVDTTRKLMWKRCALGQTLFNQACIGEPKSMTFENALNLSETLKNEPGYGDWRVPTFRELKNLISESGMWGVDKKLFPSLRSGWYWSSDVSVINESKTLAQVVNLRNSGVGDRDKNQPAYVILVRPY